MNIHMEINQKKKKKARHQLHSSVMLKMNLTFLFCLENTQIVLF